MDETKRLNEEQKQVVEYNGDKKYLCVIACPGSGKTHCLVNRIKYLLEVQLQTGKSLCLRFFIVAFNTDAAKDIKQRIHFLLDHDERFKSYRYKLQLYCGTFHAMSKRLLIESNSWQDEPHHVDEAPYRFVSRLKRQGALSNRKFRFDYLFVDEFQDVNAIQNEMIHLLSQQAKRVMVVGDPDQNIYGFRSSSVEYLYSYAQNKLECETLYLRQNYRSLPELVALGNAVRSILQKMDQNSFHLLIPDMILQKEEKDFDPLQRPHVIYYTSIPWMNSKIIQEILDILAVHPEYTIGILSRHNWGLDILRKNSNEIFQESMEKGQTILSTIHAAKGREWDAVLLIHLQASYFPDKRASLEEEWRLFFEAITRPKFQLTLFANVTDPSFIPQLSGNLFHFVNPDFKVLMDSKQRDVQTVTKNVLKDTRKMNLMQEIKIKLHGEDYIQLKRFLAPLQVLNNNSSEEMSENHESDLDSMRKLAHQFIETKTKTNYERLDRQLAYFLHLYPNCVSHVKLEHAQDEIDMFFPEANLLYYFTQDISYDYRVSLLDLIRFLYCAMEYQQQQQQQPIPKFLVHNLNTFQITEIDISQWKHGSSFYSYIHEKLKK